MADENEEFEFRLRQEKESKATQEKPEKPKYDFSTPASKNELPEAAFKLGTKLGLPPEATGAMAAGAGFFTGAAESSLTGGIGGAAGAAVKGSLRSGAETLMQSAIKPTLKQLKSGEAATAIRSMLDEGINLSAGGMRKLRGKIDALNDEIKSTIAGSTSTVNKAKVASYLTDLLDRVKKQVNPQADVNAVRQAFKDFWEHPDIGRHAGPELSVQSAQEAKQATYRALSQNAYGQERAASTEAQKTLARGLKEEIAKAVPEIRGLNAKESDLIKTLNVAERRALMDANKNPLGLTFLAHNPAAAAAFVADRSATFKSLAARMINAAGKASPQIGAAAGASAVPLSEAFKK